MCERDYSRQLCTIHTPREREREREKSSRGPRAPTLSLTRLWPTTPYWGVVARSHPLGGGRAGPRPPVRGRPLTQKGRTSPPKRTTFTVSAQSPGVDVSPSRGGRSSKAPPPGEWGSYTYTATTSLPRASAAWAARAVTPGGSFPPDEVGWSGHKPLFFSFYYVVVSKPIQSSLHTSESIKKRYGS